MSDLHTRLRLLEADHTPDGWPAVQMRDVSALLDRIAALEQEVQECDLLRERMADILTRTANALRGDPKPMHVWSWHDLPERAAGLRAKRSADER